MLIIIDPGHGGRDPGAMGNGLIEKDLTMFLALRVEERLDKYSCEAEIFQDPNVSALEDMQSVVNAANEKGADFFLSLHINSVDSPEASGFESYRYPNKPNDAGAQEIIHNSVAEYLAQNDITDRGPKVANFKVIRETNMPAVLLEGAFLSSPHDAERLKNIRFLDKLANAITWGLVQALGLSSRGNSDCSNCQKVMAMEIQLQELRQGVSDLAGRAASLAGK